MTRIEVTPAELVSLSRHVVVDGVGDATEVRSFVIDHAHGR